MGFVDATDNSRIFALFAGKFFPCVPWGASSPDFVIFRACPVCFSRYTGGISLVNLFRVFQVLTSGSLKLYFICREV